MCCPCTCVLVTHGVPESLCYQGKSERADTTGRVCLAPPGGCRCCQALLEHFQISVVNTPLRACMRVDNMAWTQGRCAKKRVMHWQGEIPHLKYPTPMAQHISYLKLLAVPYMSTRASLFKDMHNWSTKQYCFQHDTDPFTCSRPGIFQSCPTSVNTYDLSPPASSCGG